MAGGSYLLSARRRLLARYGRPVTLTRPNDTPAPAALPVQGYPASFAPDAMKPPITQGDMHLEILNDEIAAAAWPAPEQGTYAAIDGVSWAVLGAQPLYEGATCIGWTLWIRGGQA